MLNLEPTFLFLKKTLSILTVMGFISFAIAASPAQADTVVLEGDDAKAKYEELKSSNYTLRQVDKVFTLVAPDGTETKKPKDMTVKIGEFIFITNEEEKVVHNVYDQSDNSWVLKKQHPGGYAAISFSTAGEHKLRCAIHPKMKITVNVVE